MYVDDRNETPGEATSQERRDANQPDARVLGRVVQCDGSRARLTAFAEGTDLGQDGPWTVGRLVSISLGAVRTVGLVYSIESHAGSWEDDTTIPIKVDVELVGEVQDGPEGKPVFNRGITAYPHIGAVAHRIRSSDLAAVYELGGKNTVTIGNLSQDVEIQARVAVDEMLERHFAIVGTTGVGKSTAVSLIMRKAIATHPELRVLILDPHNEFSTSFPDNSVRVDTSTLDLPFWLFRLEEFVEVLFRGREPALEEVDILRDLIPQAKLNYTTPNSGSVLKKTSASNSITADTPVPYRIADVVRLLEERIGLLDSKDERPALRALKSRIQAALADPRYKFMFASRMIEDNIHETIGRIFRVPHEGRPITCFELAGLPSEVVNSVCSVLARLAFDLALGSHGRLKLLVLCEEAHRYMPADAKLGFAPTRHALSRIAKEGRKYGCYLGVVTQRPGELDPTVLSQCSTIFAMRLANERDQDIIRSAIADSSASTLSFLSAMGQREAIAFGEGVATTMRLRFEEMDPALLPGSALNQGLSQKVQDGNDVDLAAIMARLRTVGRTLDDGIDIDDAQPAQAPVVLQRNEAHVERRPSLERRQPAAPEDRRKRFASREEDLTFRRLYE